MREYARRRRAIVEVRRVVVGYRQHCAVCGVRFESSKPADTCGEACKQKRKRRRAAAAEAEALTLGGPWENPQRSRTRKPKNR